MYFVYFLVHFSGNFLSWKTFFIICFRFYSLCRRGINHFDFHFWCIGPVFFRRKREKARSMKEEMDGELFISRRSRHFSFIGNMSKVLFPICTLNWRVNNYVSCQRKCINRRNESTVIIIWICSLLLLYSFSEIINCLFSLKTLSLIKEETDTFVIN